MKPKSLVALAVVGALTFSSAFAGGQGWPLSVNESAPSTAAEAPRELHDFVASSETVLPTLRTDEQIASEPMDAAAPPLYVMEVTEYWLIGSDSYPAEPAPPVGSTSAVGAGSVGFDSTLGLMSMSSSSSMSEDLPREIVVYTPSADTLATSLGENTLLVSEHYLIPAPLSSFDGTGFLVLGIAPTEGDIALLESLKDDFIVVTPSYGG